MSRFLGIPKLKKQHVSQVSPLYSRMPLLCEWFEENLKQRLIITIPHELQSQFEQAVIKRFGRFSALNARRAGWEALRSWIQQILG